MTYVVGIDPSLVGSAVCAIDFQLGEPKMDRFSSKPPQPGVFWRMARYQALAAQIETVIRDYRPLSAVLIEGYSTGMKGNAVTSLCEFGGILRSYLTSFIGPEFPFLEVPPSTLKLFAAGKGNADKLTVAVALSKRYGVEFKTSDEYDAYALARMAACIAGFDKPANDSQKRAIDSVLNGKPKKPLPQPAE